MTGADPDACRTLALAVIRTAILDARRNAPDAVKFITATSGDWRDSRTWWCDLAGVSPDWLDRSIAEDAALRWRSREGRTPGTPSVRRANDHPSRASPG